MFDIMDKTNIFQPKKTDWDVLKEEYRFIRTEADNDDTVWAKQFAKSYYDKLFKNYCLANFSQYTTGKVGMRWRTQDEVFSGKGQFVCGADDCQQKENLKSYEVNFSYKEAGEQKKALVKLRVCPTCAEKLYYKKNQEQKLEKKEKNEKRERKEKRKRHSESQKSQKKPRLEEKNIPKKRKIIPKITRKSRKNKRRWIINYRVKRCQRGKTLG